MWLSFLFFRQNRPAHTVGGFTAAIYVLRALQQILIYVFTYWEIDSRSFRMRRLWSTKEVAWEEVQHVRGANFRPSSSTLEVDYFRPAPMSDQGVIRANPRDRQEFLRELRQFAAQAEFEA
jgi:hypothetical protein